MFTVDVKQQCNKNAIHVFFTTVCIRKALFLVYTVKNKKIRIPKITTVIVPKMETDGFSMYMFMYMYIKDAERMTNSVDPDQTAPVGAV